jgi:hypothetical protein
MCRMYVARPRNGRCAQGGLAMSRCIAHQGKPTYGALTAALVVFIIGLPCGVAAMMQNLAAGCVLMALIFMGWLAYAQKHDEFCIHGHLIKTHKPCGSLSTEM